MKIWSISIALLATCGVVLVAGCASTATRSDSAAGSGSLAVPRPLFGPDLTSNLKIPAGQQFIYAGGQRESFTAIATNEGPVPVTLVEDLDGNLKIVATVAPGSQASYRFDARAAARFENPASSPALVKVEIWGPTQVGMRYTSLNEGP